MHLPKFDFTYRYEIDTLADSFQTEELTGDLNDVDSTFLKKKSEEFFDFIGSYVGRTYAFGLYRIHSRKSAIKWTSLLEQYYPEFKDRLLCFGYDWEGNMIAQRMDDDISTIMIFEIATGDYFEFEQTIRGFHEEDLVEYKEDTIHATKFQLCLSHLSIKNLSRHECIAHRVSLLLGGEDTPVNIEITDLEVLWSLQQQIMDEINKIR